jgi:AAA+ ATPase superfamily predicted ATPase
MIALYLARQTKVTPNNMNIVERADEIIQLNEFLKSNRAEFLAIYGRRRVGKTYLIKNYFAKQKCIFLSMTGIQNGTFLEQRTACSSRISQIFYHGAKLETPDTWLKVFELLHNGIKTIHLNKKVVLFFDEFPWMATPRSRLLQALEYYWNQYWSNDKRVKLIICGSLASWIIKNIINNTGGLYNRVTYRLELQPLNLTETKSFLIKKGILLSHHQILSIHRVIGGIPLYLDQLKKGLSANQLIDQLCFSKNGLLIDEIEELFKSLFLDSDIYIKLTREIAKHQYGTTKTELSKKLNIPQSGRLVERLKDLEDAGFIMSFLPYQHRERGTYFRVIDEYTLFYFRWIEPALRSIKKFSTTKNYWLEITKSSAYNAWSGYIFETICYKHVELIREALHLTTNAIPYSWRYVPQKGSQDQGAQIDLLFDRHDDAITLCEIKYTNDLFVIDKAYAQTIKQKIEVFRNMTRTKKQLFFAIISSAGVKENLYSKELIHSVVTLDNFFII